MAYQSYVLICGGTACCSGGADKLVEEFKAQLKAQKLDETVQVVKTGCLGFCEQGPIVKVLPQGTFYVQVKEADVKEIVEKHIVGKQLIEGKILDKPSIDIVKNA